MAETRRGSMLLPGETLHVATADPRDVLPEGTLRDIEEFGRRIAKTVAAVERLIPEWKRAVTLAARTGIYQPPAAPRRIVKVDGAWLARERAALRDAEEWVRLSRELCHTPDDQGERSNA